MLVLYDLNWFFVIYEGSLLSELVLHDLSGICVIYDGYE